ncbi:MAG: discoidin domain-containing protein, partial [Phycisphaerae bacterium]|nr:discoidin domain-containing protein [Phycisphaerae bacterium]
ENVAPKSGKGAYKPVPRDGSTDVAYETLLSWTPGVVGESYNVYFGDDLDTVDSATVPDSLGQDSNSFDPGTLTFGTTYYWRVDDVNGAPDRTVFKGKVWSFTVEPYSILVPVEVEKATASSATAKNPPSLTVDGSGLDGGVHSDSQGDMWLSAAVDLSPWLMYEFDKVQKLDKMLLWNSNSVSEAFVGWGLKDVNIVTSTDGVNWTSLADSIEVTKAPGDPTYNEPQVIDLGLVQAKYVKINILSNWGGFLKQYGVSEVQFYGLPVYVRTPQPADGSTDVDPGMSLSWRGGRGATSHEIYLSEDLDAVADGSALAASIAGDSYDLTALDLQLGNTYYWKVNAVSDTAYEGDILSFTLAEPLMVDDFEGYTNFSPDRPFQTWLDGYGYSADEFFPVEYQGNGTGSGVGHDIWGPGSPYFGGKLMEDTIVKSGRGSLPFYYSNTGGAASQIDRKWSKPQDWSLHGIQALVLYISGDPANTGTSLYAKINGQKITCPKSNVLQSSLWTQWSIDLTSLNVTSVNTLSVGVDGAGSGVLYLDDFGLYREAPDSVVSVDPGAEGLAAKYSLDNTLEDTSGHGLGAGTVIGGPFFVEGRPGNGMALSFNGLDDYVTLPIGGVIASADSITIACWADFSNEGGAWQRLWDFGSGDGANPYMFLCPRVNTNGPIRLAIRSATVPESVINSTSTLPSGWQHVTAVIDGDTRTMTLYVNGAVVAQGSTQVIPSELGNTTQNYLAKSQYPDALYQGSLDELMIYTRVLSEGEIRYLAGDK